MKIVETTSKYIFVNLAAGDVFSYSDNLYMKIKANSSGFNSVNLTTSTLAIMSLDSNIAYRPLATLTV